MGADYWESSQSNDLKIRLAESFITVTPCFQYFLKIFLGMDWGKMYFLPTFWRQWTFLHCHRKCKTNIGRVHGHASRENKKKTRIKTALVDILIAPPWLGAWALLIVQAVDQYN